MMSTLTELFRQQGAIFSPETEIPISFNNEVLVRDALQNGAVICDRRHWGLIRLTGGDRLRYLHNQSTNQIQLLQPGQSCETVLINSTGRTLDLATVWITEEEIFLIVSPNRRQFLMEWFDRFLFPMDKVTLQDVSTEYAVFDLMGPQTQSILQGLTNETLIEWAENEHRLLAIAGVNCRCKVGDRLGLEGYTLLIPIADATIVWEALTSAGLVAMGDRAWEQLRIKQGRPFPDAELTEDYNPLETGLWKFISFDKGCYIGQETIARLNTYKGVKQRLWGLTLSAPVEPKTPIFLEGEKVGLVTSVDTENLAAIAYIRTKAGGEGLTVQVGEGTANVVSLPYVKHEYI
jgi:folate-binding protein YgfZ